MPLPHRGPRWRLWAALALGAAVVAAAAGLFVFLSNRARPALPQAVVPLTTYPGSELYPSFSPDGNQLVFTWDGDKQDNYDIYVKQVDGVTPVRLTADPAPDNYPAWSPDGRSIAFTRFLSGRRAVILIPSIGGPERKLLEITGSSVAWSPDSKSLVFADGTPPGLYLFSVETGERKQLTTPPAQSVGDDFPAVSPDGRRLAFIRLMSYSSTNIYDVALGKGFEPVAAPVQLSSAGTFSVPAWTANGRELIFSEYANNLVNRFWRVNVAAGTPPSPIAGEGGGFPAISRQGTRLAFAREMNDNNIWRAPTHEGRGESPSAALIASTRSDQGGRYSPDGKQIVFVSDRSGQTEIWIASDDGTNQIQLTSLKGEQAGSPSYSPDGQTILFDRNASGTKQVYTIPVSGGKPTQITNLQPDSVRPRYSRDGNWIYFSSNHTGREEVWKTPSHAGEAVQVTRNGGQLGEESRDGVWLYFLSGSPQNSKLMKMPAAGGPETEVVSSVFLRGFSLASGGVYFFHRNANRSNEIRYLDEKTGAVRTIQALSKPLWAGISLSPDEQFVLWTQADQYGTDLMMIENFR